MGGGKDGRTADQSVEKENVFQFERSRGKLGIEEVSRRKAGGLCNKCLFSNYAASDLLLESTDNESQHIGKVITPSRQHNACENGYTRKSRCTCSVYNQLWRGNQNVISLPSWQIEVCVLSTHISDG